MVALHSPTNGVQFFSNVDPLIEAYNASIAGDTIYIPGGVFTPPANFDKKLTIYGAGHFPSATTATLPTNINGNITLNENADGFHLQGVNILGHLTFTNNHRLDNVTIKRCRIQAQFNVQGAGTNRGENNYFTENIFVGIFYYADNLLNSYFISNIFQSPIYAVCTQLTFLNNVFLFNGNSGNWVFNGGAYSCIFKNNIFVSGTNSYSDFYIVAGTNTFSHNIFCHAAPALGSNPILINNNYVAKADVFVNQADFTFDYTDDFHLQSATATLLGDDGTERGLYGGVAPFKEESIPVNPHISSAIISNQSNASGLINVNIEVEAQTR